MCARGFFCSQNSARPGFSEPKIATLASYAARIVELSLFMHKNGQYSGSLCFFINKRVLKRWLGEMTEFGQGGAWGLNVISQGHMGRTKGGEEGRRGIPHA